MELHSLTIKSASEKLAKGEISSVELTENILARIKIVEPKVGAFITVCEEEALKMAKTSDERRKNGKTLSEIDGIPIAVKDLFLTYGIRTTAASKILDDFIPPYESTVTAKLWAAGAVLIGKTNLDQFAMGSSTETSAYNTATDSNSTTRNPWDLDRIPGGSSGGSAAAVAADLCVAAVGTDTGGSIRQPAGFCGVVGYKPTYGLVSRSGVIAMASSTDVIGPITRNLDDTAAILDIIAGRDELDSTTIEKDSKGYQLSTSSYQLNAAKIGIIREYMAEGLELGVKQVIDGAVNKLKSAGAEISEVSLPSLPLALAVYYIVCPAEVSSNLARYDGQRYGYSEQSATDLLSSYELSREKGFGAEAKRRIMIGTYVLSSGYYDAYYKKAQTVRTKIISEFADAFEKYDVLVGPTSPTTAFKIGEKVNDPLSMYLSDIMTVAANMSGNPAISIPAGLSSELPVGLQLIGPMKGDRKLLEITKACEELL